MISFSRLTATSRETVPAARRADSRLERTAKRLPVSGVVLGNEVLFFPEIGDLLDQRPVLVDEESFRGDRSAVQGVVPVDLRDRLFDVVASAPILAGELPDDAPPGQPVPRVPNPLLIPGAPVQAVEDRSPPDP